MKYARIALAAAATCGLVRPAAFDGQEEIPEELKPVVDKLVQQKVDEAVSGLKTKNNELLGDIRKLKDSVKAFEGLDPVAIKGLMEKLGNDEEAQLIAKGKIDEVLAKRTERLNADWQKKLDAQVAAAQKLQEKNQKLVQKATNEAIIRAHAKSGAYPEAVDDFILRAKGAGFTMSDDGEVIAVDAEGQPILGKDAKTPLTPTEWAESLRETASHLWPKAQSSGANGSTDAAKGGKIDPSLSPETRLAQARTHQPVSQQPRT